jgi:site-specific DNA-methyltransferase (adenine-specific)
VPGCPCQTKGTLYYDQDGITIYHADCRELLDALSWDVVITDPPYGVGLTVKTGLVRCGPAHRPAPSRYADDEDSVRTLLADVLPCLTAGRALIFPGPARLWDYPPAAAVGCVFETAGAGRSAWGFQCSHPILYYGKDPFLADGRGSRPNSFDGVVGHEVYLAGGGSSTRGIDHPCVKPLRWMSWAVHRASRRGETILDPFMGSGTTLIAARRDGRHCIGIEIEERYCEIAANRLAQGVLDFVAPANSTAIAESLPL